MVSSEIVNDKTDIAVTGTSSKGRLFELLTSARVVLVLMMLFGSIVQFAQRVSFTVALICMTNHTAVSREKSASSVATSNLIAVTTQSSGQATCQMDRDSSGQADASLMDGDFDWDFHSHGYLNSAFFIGYLAGQLPMGLILQRFGGKWPILIMMSLYAACSLVAPGIAHAGFWYFYVTRVIAGFSAAGWFPTIFHMLPLWIPLEERGRMSSLALSGSNIGSIVALPLTGWMCESSLRYPLVFYSWGGLNVLFVLMWLFLVYDKPQQHPRISAEEKRFLTQHCGADSSAKDDKKKLPVLSILKSATIWAYVGMHLALDWNVYVLLVSIPTYMKDVLKFSVKDNATLTALMYLGIFLGQLGLGALSDFFIKRKLLSLVKIRKGFNTISSVLCAILLMCITLITCENKYVAVGLLTVALFIVCGVMVSAYMTPMDVAPQYAGLIFAFGNSLSAVMGFCVPLIVSALVKDSTSQSEWQRVFMLSSAVLVVTSLIYAWFASTEVAPWARQTTSSGSSAADDDRKKLTDCLPMEIKPEEKV